MSWILVSGASGFAAVRARRLHFMCASRTVNRGGIRDGVD